MVVLLVCCALWAHQGNFLSIFVVLPIKWTHLISVQDENSALQIYSYLAWQDAYMYRIVCLFSVKVFKNLNASIRQNTAKSWLDMRREKGNDIQQRSRTAILEEAVLLLYDEHLKAVNLHFWHKSREKAT